MAKGALFFGWGTAVRGRETKALQVFQEALQYWGARQQSGDIDSFEPYFLEAHGGDLAGCLIVKGDQEKLARLRADAEFDRLNTRAQLVVENFGVVSALTGAELQAQMAVFQQNIAELA